MIYFMYCIRFNNVIRWSIKSVSSFVKFELLGLLNKKNKIILQEMSCCENPTKKITLQ